MKVFRKLRERLLKNGRFSQYLLYAIGEIILVVIGILIALQINNSSEDYKKQKEADKLFRELYTEFRENQKGLDQAKEGALLYVLFLEQTLANWDSLSYENIKSYNQNPYARDYLSTLFYLTTYSQFSGSKKDIYLKAVGDGSLTLIDQDFVGIISNTHANDVRMDEMIAQEYEMGKEINLHIASRYADFLVGFKRASEHDLDEETLSKLLIGFRKDGKLKYLINTRLEMAKIRTELLRLQNYRAKEYLKIYKPEKDY